MNLDYRKTQLDAAGEADFDAVIIGGGISGAAIFHQLSQEGYRILLLDKGDFAGATSQASAMMVWGNLTDLRKLSFIKVGRVCNLRERLIRERSEWVSPRAFRYLPTLEKGRKPLTAFAALFTYWLLSRGRRSIPRYQKEFTELSFLQGANFPYSFEYEEAALEPSDARFVLGWILERANSSEQMALNYCALQGGCFNRADQRWNLDIYDSLLMKEASVKAKVVINAAGIWADKLNKDFGIESPYKHAFGKGVFLGIRRDPNHLSSLMIETKEAKGCMALIPWGPISLWGPTENRISRPEQGFSPEPDELRFLLKELNRHLAEPIGPEEIVSLRCGVRPLPVKLGFPEAADTLKIPRDYRIYSSQALPWISIYGGKITSCAEAARSVSGLLYDLRIKPRAARHAPETFDISSAEMDNFPGLAVKFPSARWCAEKEMCRNLEDYLRRRTNISQWIPRGGLGRHNENLSHLESISAIFCGNDLDKARAAVEAYQMKISREFDGVLAEAF